MLLVQKPILLGLLQEVEEVPEPMQKVKDGANESNFEAAARAEEVRVRQVPRDPWIFGATEPQVRSEEASERHERENKTARSENTKYLT